MLEFRIPYQSDVLFHCYLCLLAVVVEYSTNSSLNVSRG
uniref:Uncharacterized protein n=1 Tax=Nelumbo nucifera TaxID=4432 RepID=A0A822XK22_NELNU|nr:TPA_asm: hypothetical protein HUJ06_020944 [Nelumbo nucifera]